MQNAFLLTILYLVFFVRKSFLKWSLQVFCTHAYSLYVMLFENCLWKRSFLISQIYPFINPIDGTEERIDIFIVAFLAHLVPFRLCWFLLQWNAAYCACLYVHNKIIVLISRPLRHPSSLRGYQCSIHLVFSSYPQPSLHPSSTSTKVIFA